jgi:hypothetical protein
MGGKLPFSPPLTEPMQGHKLPVSGSKRVVVVLNVSHEGHDNTDESRCQPTNVVKVLQDTPFYTLDLKSKNQQYT